MNENELSRIIVDAGICVHRELGPGLLENAYEQCLAHELRDRGLTVLQQEAMPVVYRGIRLDVGYRLDLWVERKVIIEVKAVRTLDDVHRAQLLTYLKLAKNRLGLLMNFNVRLLRDGIERMANGM